MNAKENQKPEGNKANVGSINKLIAFVCLHAIGEYSKIPAQEASAYRNGNRRSTEETAMKSDKKGEHR